MNYEEREDFERRKRDIEKQLDEYGQAIISYAEWMEAWRKRCIADGVAKGDAA